MLIFCSVARHVVPEFAARCVFEEKKYGGVRLTEALQFHHEGAVGGKDVASLDVGGWTACLVKNLKQ